MKILLFEWITSVGGVQNLLRTIMPVLSKKNEFHFLDPYAHEFGKEICKSANIKYINRPIGTRQYIGWNRKLLRPYLFIKYGFMYARYLYLLCKYLKMENMELIYTHSKKGVCFTYLISTYTGIKYVYHAHGFNSYKDIGWFYKKAMVKSKCIIAVSNDVRNKMVAAGVPEEKISVIYNGININRIMQKGNELSVVKKSEGVFRVIFIGSIQKGKGIEVLIEAFNKLLKEKDMCELFIVGEVPIGGSIDYLNLLKNKAKLEDESKIKFLGFQNNVYPLISKSDVLVLPSVVEESFGLVLTEAMCLGKPVIGSSVGGVPEVIRDGQNGYLVTAGSSQKLFECLILLQGNLRLQKEMGSNGADTVRTKFDSLTQAAKISDILAGN